MNYARAGELVGVEPRIRRKVESVTFPKSKFQQRSRKRELDWMRRLKQRARFEASFFHSWVCVWRRSVGGPYQASHCHDSVAWMYDRAFAPGVIHCAMLVIEQVLCVALPSTMIFEAGHPSQRTCERPRLILVQISLFCGILESVHCSRGWRGISVRKNRINISVKCKALAANFPCVNISTMLPCSLACPAKIWQMGRGWQSPPVAVAGGVNQRGVLVRECARRHFLNCPNSQRCNFNQCG